MTLTAEERAVITTRLADAEEALHQLTIGGHARVFVDQNGERVEYTTPQSTRLRAYIYELKLKLGKSDVTGPMDFRMLG